MKTIKKIHISFRRHTFDRLLRCLLFTSGALGNGVGGPLGPAAVGRAEVCAGATFGAIGTLIGLGGGWESADFSNAAVLFAPEDAGPPTPTAPSLPNPRAKLIGRFRGLTNCDRLMLAGFTDPPYKVQHTSRLKCCAPKQMTSILCAKICRTLLRVSFLRQAAQQHILRQDGQRHLHKRTGQQQTNTTASQYTNYTIFCCVGQVYTHDGFAAT